MIFNKSGTNHNKNGFINILFDESKTIEQRQAKIRDANHINRFIQENAFPKNQVKHMRIVKINDTVYNNLATLKADHIKRMFVDGSHVRQLTQNRQVCTQDQARRPIARDYTPSSLQSRRIEANKKNLTFYEQVQRYKQNSNKQSKDDQQFNEVSNQVMILPLSQKSLQQTAASCSIKNIRISLRQARSDKKKEGKKQGDLPKQLSVELKKQLFRFYSSSPSSPENISAKAYVVYQYKNFSNNNPELTNKCLHTAFNTKINLEIASLTKIMTCILTLDLCAHFKVDIADTYVTVSQFETEIEGTSAEIQAGESYSIEQLLYGLMLPSGNDASLALSSFCGHLLERNKRDKYSYEQINKKHYYRKFIMEMNKKCNDLGMKRTIYTNSHGLPNMLNKSCLFDLVILINYALANPRFRQIISCQAYQTTVSKCSKDQMIKRHVRWDNTHKLVVLKPEMYLGIKTGTTDTAGPCLASLLSIAKREFIIIVLNSRTSRWRYRDTQELRQWLCKKQKL